jgi:hypothetical protein
MRRFSRAPFVAVEFDSRRRPLSRKAPSPTLPRKRVREWRKTVLPVSRLPHMDVLMPRRQGCREWRPHMDVLMPRRQGCREWRPHMDMPIRRRPAASAVLRPIYMNLQPVRNLAPLAAAPEPAFKCMTERAFLIRPTQHHVALRFGSDSAS